LVVIIVIPAVALFVLGGGDQPAQIILPTPGYWTTQWRRLGAARAAPNLESVNFALRVQDEGHYRVPKIGETPSPELSAVSDAAASQALTGDTGQSTTGPIDLNTASAELLESLSGIGPTGAGDIVADRGVNRPFLTVEQIMRVQGIGATTYTNIRDLVSLDTSP